MEQAKEPDETTHKTRKEDYNNRSKVKLVNIKFGDRVLMSQKKSLVDPLFDPAPYEVIKVEVSRIMVKR